MLKKISEIYRPFRIQMLGVFGFIALSQALNLFAPYLHGKVINALVNHQPLGYVNLLVLATLPISLFRILGIGYYRERYELKHVDFVIAHHINHLTIERLFGFSIAQHTNENSGIKRSVINRGQHALRSMIYTLLYQVIPIIIEVTMLVGLLLFFSFGLGLIVLTSVACYTAFVFYTNRRFGKEFRKMEKMYNQNGKFQDEFISNAELVLSHAQESRVVKECDENLDSVQYFTRGIWLSFNKFTAIRNCIVALGSVLVLWKIKNMVYARECSIGDMYMFLAWSGAAFGRVSDVSGLHRQLMQMYSSVKRYFEMLAIEPDVRVIENPVSPATFAGKIEFKNVTLSYKRRDTPDSDEEEEVSSPNEQKEITPALENVSFTIEPGQTVAFVGESGAGKSTIVHALARYQDVDKGQITVDGHDIRILDLKKYRESLGIVNQKTFLFDQSIRYNITFGLNGRAAEVTEDQLHDIANVSAINRFYPRLEKGFDTLIGERGVKLSGGEQQRIGIARALIKQPDILIFDEATSNLDADNEEVIRNSIMAAAKNRTTIIIAHRFCTIRQVDKVFVFDKGKLVDQGTHTELAGRCEAYQRLVKNQAL